MKTPTEEDLREQYGEHGEHPEYPAQEWMEDVRRGDTRRGYWPWVAYQIETRPEEDPVGADYWVDHDPTLDNPTLDKCREMGRTHAAYGWAPCPGGNWTDEQKAAYDEGFDERSAVR